MIRGKPKYVINSMTIMQNDMAASVTVDTWNDIAEQSKTIGETILGVQVNLQA